MLQYSTYELPKMTVKPFCDLCMLVMLLLLLF